MYITNQIIKPVVRDRRGQDLDDLLRRDDERAARAQRHRGDIGAAPQFRDGCFEPVGLEQGRDLGLVGEQDVDVPVHEIQERAAVALHAERVREREAHFPPAACASAAAWWKASWACGSS